MTGYRIIYACPDCFGDLDDEGFSLWCPACQRSVPYAMADGPYDDGDPDDHH